jgi:hypothetical protein
MPKTVIIRLNGPGLRAWHYEMHMDKRNPALNDESREQTERWRGQHGQPDFEYLQSLADDGSPGALEEMMSIAEDLDAEHDKDSSFQELMQAIRAAAERNDSSDSGIVS